MKVGDSGGREAVEEAGENAGGECAEGGRLEKEGTRESEDGELLFDGLHRFPCMCCSKDLK